MANVQQLQDTLEAQAPLINALKNAFHNPKHSDLIIRCADNRWTVHKVIVCSQSPVLAKACEGRFKEAEEGLITLQEDDPRVVEAMLQFIYTLDFDDSCHDADEMPAIVFNVNVHIAADKFDIPVLRKLTAFKFHAYALTKWDTAGFAEAAALVFDAGTAVEESLREIVVSIATKNAKKLLGQDEVGTRFHAVASATPALAVALWQRQVEGKMEEAEAAEVKDPKGYGYTCPGRNCGAFQYGITEDTYNACAFCQRTTHGRYWVKQVAVV
ncbi:hypothetical protein LTR56_011899 [Elasticomyces elasticus]|nr:hypothetical protein LTR56_011899 [Elasticomyces elasticus]KAK3654831.1 hypothetical protein LTR22_010599 [Elasticomyces elasticus]KAK4920644.1 hypothetical protein LTR49_011893 [Elasticomyces elasticus]KAK5759330.1 hypothetical protein LTS12_010493 [Elasticomyces elasticus]